DPLNNPISAKFVTLQVTGGAISIVGGSPTVQTNSSGQAAFGGVVINQASTTPYSLDAIVCSASTGCTGGNAIITVTTKSSGPDQRVTIVPGAISSTTSNVPAPCSPSIAGATFADPVTLKDANNNPLAGQVVTLMVSGAAVPLVGAPAAIQTDPTGSATVSG